MAVVINEFEVVPAEPSAPQPHGVTTSEEKETSASPLLPRRTLGVVIHVQARDGGATN